MRPRGIRTGTQRPNYVNIFRESLRFSGRTGAQLVSAARPPFERLWSYKNECFFIFFFDDLKAVTLTVCAVCQKFCMFSFYSFFFLRLEWMSFCVVAVILCFTSVLRIDSNFVWKFSFIIWNACCGNWIVILYRQIFDMV